MAAVGLIEEPAQQRFKQALHEQSMQEIRALKREQAQCRQEGTC